MQTEHSVRALLFRGSPAVLLLQLDSWTQMSSHKASAHVQLLPPPPEKAQKSYGTKFIVSYLVNRQFVSARLSTSRPRSMDLVHY